MITLRDAKLIYALKEGETYAFTGDGIVIARPEREPFMVRYDEGGPRFVKLGVYHDTEVIESADLSKQ